MFAKDKVSQSLIDAVNKVVGITEAKADELPPIDKDAAAARKARQARLDAIEDAKSAKAEKGEGEKKISSTRTIAGKAYGGSKQKDDVEMDESADCVTKPEAKTIAKKEVKGHEKSMHKDDEMKESAGNPGPVRKQVPSTMEKPSKEDMAAWHAKQKEKHAYEPKKEELKGNQHKIDANKNGKIDADDFKKLRGEEVERVDEISDTTKSSYIGKAVDDIKRQKENSKSAMADYEKKGGQGSGYDRAERADAKVEKRASGIHRALLSLKKEETDLEESRGHKILATKLRQIDTMSSGIAPDLSVDFQSIKDKIKDIVNTKRAQIVNQKHNTEKMPDNIDQEMDMKHKLNKLAHGYGNVTFNENHNFGGNVDSHIKSLGHGKIGFIMDQHKDNLIAVHHQDAGKHHLSIFHKGNLVNQSSHDNFENASGHAHSALTTKKGIKSLNLKEDIQIDELSKPMLATYIRRASDPTHSKSNVNLASLAADKLSKGNSKDDGEKEDKKAYQRSRSIGLAAAKMAREEVEDLDEVSADLLGRYSDKASKEYNDPKTPERKKVTRRAGLMLGYNKVKARANVPATYEEMSFTDRLLQRAWLPESRGPVSGASETFTDNNMGEMTDAQMAKREKIVMSMKKKEGEFKDRYGKNWKNVMYATATKSAMAEEHEEEGHEDEAEDKKLIKKMMKKGSVKEDKDDGVPFDRPYSTEPAEKKDKSGAIHTPMSRVKHLAKTAMKRLTKETMMGKAGTTSEENEND